jgi:hypothetical protein
MFLTLKAMVLISKQTETNFPIQFKGWTIEEYTYGYMRGELMAYPTATGPDHDADFDGESFTYCGNCLFGFDVEDLKDQIEEKLMEAYPIHNVEMNKKIYPFEWLEDAVKFATMFNGVLKTEFESI